MQSTLAEIAPDIHRISAFHPEAGQRYAYRPYTEATLLRLAALKPQTLALMHGSAFQGYGEAAILNLAKVIRETLGQRKGG